MTPPATAAINAASERRRHVAVCAFPFSSHPGTLFLLSRKIAASAPDNLHVSFFTTSKSALTLSAAFRSEEPNLRTFDVDDGLPEGNKSVHPLEAMKCFFESAGEGLRKSMAAAESEIGVTISCVVADAFLSHVCRDIAKERAVKWAALWTSAAAALVAHMHTDQLRTRIGPQGIEAHKHETLNEYIPGTPLISIGNLPREVLTDLNSAISQMLHLMSLSLHDAAAIAINSFDHLESTVTATLNANFSNKFLHAGPFTLTLPSTTGLVLDQHGCLPWLDTHIATPASVIYISFGTAHAPPTEELAALAEALEVVGVPFLWSLSTNSTACLPEGFVERTRGKGMVVPWAPQISVLRHVAVGAHLTHCGWNSVTESIVCGVPMICRPLTIGDQLLDKELVESVWEIGVEVEGGKLTKSAVVRAVERVLLGEEGRRMREKIKVMKRFAEEAAAEPGGGSVQSLNKFIGVITS